MKKIEQKKSGYDASSITVLEGLDPVRKRPGMYIGSTGSSGLHHLIWEVVDNSIDEAMGGYCSEITVTLLPNNRVSVTDNGRGIPVDIHKQFKVSALELVLTKLHAGGKFGGGGYKVSGGLHGVGVSVVNALSIMMRAEVKRDGKLWVQEYQRGKPKAKVKSVGAARGTGTTITFDADSEIFPVIAYDWQTVIDHLRQQAYLTKGVTITVRDERVSDARQTHVFHFEGGIKSYIRHLNHHKGRKHDAIFYVDKEAEGKRVEVSLQYVDDYKETVLAFANNIFNPEGGTHLVGFRTALTRTLNNYARTKGFLKEKDENLSGEDTREGLTAIISVKLQDPQFEGQTKAKLGNDDIRTLVDTVFSEALATFLEEHPRDGEAIVGKCLLAARARLAARAARDSVLRKGALEGLMLPGKLADCSSRDAKNTELFIVEGDSAGGCFSGDTKIALADGRNITFKELIKEHSNGKKHYCYTIKSDGSIGIEAIQNPRITKRNASVVKIILDNNEEIICTPDHQFMLRDGSYAAAKNLTPRDSLMPLYREISLVENTLTIREAVGVYYNHKIKAVVPLRKRMDVYDIEVPETHNFALASGIFVHNSAKQGRNREFQAILPLRGKILNVERARIDKMLANNELRSLIIALGTNIGEQFNLTELRYERIVIMTDADVDGSHIRTLLLTVFWRYLQELIKTGHLYIAQPPLYRIQKGKEVRYVYSDDEKERVLKELEKVATEKREVKKVEKQTVESDQEEVRPSGIGIQRYKGLGEMNPDQLWETTMNPATRMMKRVTVDDAEKTDEIFDILMGSEVAPRKHFITAHAKNVKNLDI